MSTDKNSSSILSVNFHQGELKKALISVKNSSPSCLKDDSQQANSHHNRSNDPHLNFSPKNIHPTHCHQATNKRLGCRDDISRVGSMEIDHYLGTPREPVFYSRVSFYPFLALFSSPSPKESSFLSPYLHTGSKRAT